MVVNFNSDLVASVFQLFGHRYIGFAWVDITGRVIVHQNKRGRVIGQCPAYNLARVDRRVVNGAITQYFISQQSILLIQKQKPELLANQ